ncbi:MAG: hypothetical protein NTV56_01860 [Alphaproteobacteria bacterium]|nr:hypothetical protein [Alphaproteobacteria bacterium]
MSRCAILVVLAVSAALIATPASADPECFGDTCRTPDVSEPPLSVEPEPLAAEVPAPPAAAQVPSSVQRLTSPPTPVASVTANVVPMMAAEAAVPIQPPAVRPVVVAESPKPRPAAPVRAEEPRAAEVAVVAQVATVAEEPKKPARVAVASARTYQPAPSYDAGQNGYVVGLPVVTGSVVVAAPTAKIITIDSGED